MRDDDANGMPVLCIHTDARVNLACFIAVNLTRVALHAAVERAQQPARLHRPRAREDGATVADVPNLGRPRAARLVVRLLQQDELGVISEDQVFDAVVAKIGASAARRRVASIL